MILRSIFWLLAGVLLIAALQGCGTAPVGKASVVTLRPPVALLACQAAPEAPPKPRTQQAVALHILALREALDDCQHKLEAVRKWAAGR